MSLMKEIGFLPYDNPRKVSSSLIPGTNRFADISHEEMAKTSVFAHLENTDFKIRPSFKKVSRFDLLYGRFVESDSDFQGYEVVYPNGKICSHIFQDEKSAENFIKEVKNKI